MPDKLKRLLDSLALPKPCSFIYPENGDGISSVEWEAKNGDYYMIELDGDDLSIMSKVDNVVKHWEVIETCLKS